MSLIITEPIKTINGILTKAIAAESQLLYLVQREDYQSNRLREGTTGNIDIIFQEDILSDFNVGDTIYYSSSNVPSYNGLYTVNSVFNVGGGEFAIRCAGVYTANGGIGYVNNLTTRANYRIEIEIRDSEDSFSLFGETFVYIPNQAGILNLDVGGIVKSYLKDNGIFSFEYYLNITEEWEGKPKQPPLSKSYTFTTIGAQTSSTFRPAFLEAGADTDFIVGEWYYFKFNPENAVYTNGAYECVALPAVNSAEFAKTETATDSTGGAVSMDGDTGEDTTILQAILGYKQLLSLGGANMWEYLLREGLNPNYNLSDWSIKSSFNASWLFNGSWIMQGTLVNPQRSDYLGIDGALSGGTYSVKIGYKITTSGNTSGTVAIFQVEDNNTSSIYNLPINEIEQTLSITINGFSNYFGFTVLPQANDGTVTYFEFTSIDLSEMITAKFLTRFENPVMWRGWNRTIAAIRDREYSSRVETQNWRLLEYSADINKTEIGYLNGAFGTQDIDVQIYKLSNTDSFFNKVFINNNANNTTLSEVLYFKMENECINPIMLDWINSLGGVDQWLFEIKSNNELEVDAGVVAETPITTDIEYITRTKRRFSRSLRQRITLGADGITKDQLKALAEIKTTESLRIYLSKDGVNFIDAIVVDTFTTQYKGGELRYNFLVVIEFPDGFIFEDGILY